MSVMTAAETYAKGFQSLEEEGVLDSLSGRRRAARRG